MKILGRLVALLFAILAMALLPLAIWITSTDRVFSDADIYLDTLRRQELYSEILPGLLPAIIQEEAATTIDGNNAAPFLEIVSNLNEEDWRSIAAELTPPDWLQAQVERNTRALFDWLHDRTPYPDLAFETASLRDRLSGSSGQRAVNLILASWPPCNEEQLQALLDPNRPQGVLPFCQPPGEYLAYTSEALTSVLREQASQIPDVVPNPGWLDNGATRAELNELRIAFRFLQALVIEFWLVVLALLALVVVFTVRSLKAFSRWQGITLVAGGIAALLPIPLLLSPVLLSPLVGDALGDPGRIRPDAPRYAEFVLNDIARALVGQLTLPVIALAGGLVLIGFVLLGISVIARSPEEVEAESGTLARLQDSQTTPGAPPHTKINSVRDPFAPE